jgi:hypothetical protein
MLVVQPWITLTKLPEKTSIGNSKPGIVGGIYDLFCVAT